MSCDFLRRSVEPELDLPQGEDGSGHRGLYADIQFMISKNMVMSGFVVFDIFPKYEDEFYKTVPCNITEGKLK
jgi:hypothetical protein